MCEFSHFNQIILNLFDVSISICETLAWFVLN